MIKNTICLWYNRDAEEAAHFYAQTFHRVMAHSLPLHRG